MPRHRSLPGNDKMEEGDSAGTAAEERWRDNGIYQRTESSKTTSSLSSSAAPQRNSVRKDQDVGGFQYQREQQHVKQEEAEWNSLLQQLRSLDNHVELQQQPSISSLISCSMITHDTTTQGERRGSPSPEDDGGLPSLDLSNPSPRAFPPEAGLSPNTSTSLSNIRTIVASQQNCHPTDHTTTICITAHRPQVQKAEQQQQESPASPGIYCFLNQEQCQQRFCTSLQHDQKQRSRRNHQDCLLFPHGLQQDARDASGAWSAPAGPVERQSQTSASNTSGTNTPTSGSTPGFQYDISSKVDVRGDRRQTIQQLSLPPFSHAAGHPSFRNTAHHKDLAVTAVLHSAFQARIFNGENIKSSRYRKKQQLDHQLVVLPAFTPSQERAEQFTYYYPEGKGIAVVTNEREQDEHETLRTFPCKARSIMRDHNSKTAIITLRSDAKHGDALLCCHPECVKKGIKFVYCCVCDGPVAKVNFTTRHKHQDRLPKDKQQLERKPCQCKDNEEGSGIPLTISLVKSTNYSGQTSEKGISSTSTLKPAPGTLDFSPPASPSEQSKIDERSKRWIELMKRRPHIEDRELMKQWISEVVISTDDSGSLVLDHQVGAGTPSQTGVISTVRPQPAVAAPNEQSQENAAPGSRVPSRYLDDDFSQLVEEALQYATTTNPPRKRQRTNSISDC